MDGSIRRSWLMVPSDDVAQVEQAATSAADVIVLDLMEFVPEAMKPAAREGLPEAIRGVAQGGAEIFAQVDKELLYADLSAAVRGRRIGFKGALCLRVNQVEPLNRGFTPTSSEIQEARELIADYHAGTQHGSAVMRLQDRIIDLATVSQASQLLAYADACAQRDAGKTQAQQRAAL